jgi:hypothetical protein
VLNKVIFYFLHMAYFRPTMISTSNDQQHPPTKLQPDEYDKDNKKEEPNRPLYLFSIELTHLSPYLKFFILAGGLILFMCLYGYYQELVIYGWFDRKLSMFSTFLHFLGCLMFAQLQRMLSKDRHPAPQTGCISCAKPTGFGRFFVFTLGNASPRVALFYYVLLIAVRTGAQGFSNLSMTQINYPAKVLFKSATPVVTMVIGLFWFKKTYPLRDYLVVGLLVFGLCVFIVGDASGSPQSTRLGIIYVTISMFGSAGLPMIQEHCMTTYNSSIEDLLYHTFLGSALMSLVMSLASGEFTQGVVFLVNTGSLHTWFIMFAFTIFGFLGSNFSAGLTLQYGALVNGISNTFRKALTLGLSFFLFPERNELTTHKIIGSAIFFSGLMVRIFSKTGHGSSSSGSGNSKEKGRYKELNQLDMESGGLLSGVSPMSAKSRVHGQCADVVETNGKGSNSNGGSMRSEGDAAGTATQRVLTSSSPKHAKSSGGSSSGAGSGSGSGTLVGRLWNWGVSATGSSKLSLDAPMVPALYQYELGGLDSDYGELVRARSLSASQVMADESIGVGTGSGEDGQQSKGKNGLGAEDAGGGNFSPFMFSGASGANRDSLPVYQSPMKGTTPSEALAI